jgi:hypothetical protein
MRAPFEPTDPVKAKQIALHTEGVLKSIRECESIGQLKNIYDGFAAYSATMGVVEPIREHVQKAFNETATTIAARERNAKSAASQEITARIIGENAE